MAYEFPVADFSALADIPRVYQAGVQDRLRKSIFEDLKSIEKPEDFNALGVRALRAGLGPEAFQLFGEAARQKQVEQSGLLNRLMLDYLNKNRGGTSGDATPPLSPTPLTPPPSSPDTPPPPSRLAPVPFILGSSDALSAPSQLSPTDQVLVQAQGAMAPSTPTPPVQLAGPSPTPDTLPPSLNAPPPSALTATEGPRGRPLLQVPGMTAGGPTFSPDQLPPAPAGVPAMGAAPVVRSTPGAALNQSPREAARVEANRLYEQLRQFPTPPRGLPMPPQYQILKDAYDRALAAANATDIPELSFQQEIARRQQINADRMQAGQEPLPELTRPVFKTEQETAQARYQDINKLLEDYRKKGEAGGRLSFVVNQLGDIIKDPQFATDNPIPFYDTMQEGYSKLLARIKETLRPILPAGAANEAAINYITRPGDLRESFRNLAHQAGVAMLENIGSKGEKDTLQSLIPQLSSTPQGLRDLNEMMKQAADRNELAYKTAREYTTADKDFRGTPQDLQDLVAKRMDEYNATHGSILKKPDGGPTDLAKRIEKTTGVPLEPRYAHNPATGAVIKIMPNGEIVPYGAQ